MNDDFLRRARRPPPPAFERQLRARLREQELKETSRRRPSWRLLGIALLIGGSALATATYLTFNHTRPSSLPAQPHTESAPIESPSAEEEDASGPINRWIDLDPRTSTVPASMPSAQQGTTVSTARDNGSSPASTDATGGSKTEMPRYVASTGREARGSMAARPVRIVVEPNIAPFARDTSAGQRYTPSASFEEDGANAALPTLCAEDHSERPDIVVTSRRANKQEFRQCAKRYKVEVLEATLGHIGVVVTRAKISTPLQLSPRALRLALMKQVPAPDNSSQLIDNPYTHWNQIDPALEDRRIEVLGPARGTREFLVFATILLAPACADNASLDPELCRSVREDGVYSDARFDANFVRQRLWSDPNAVAIMDYRFYADNQADLLGSLLTGPGPSRESIVNGSYAGALTLHAYVNHERYKYVPKVSQLVKEYLRVPVYLHGLIRPDADLDAQRPYDDGPKLMEVKLD